MIDFASDADAKLPAIEGVRALFCAVTDSKRKRNSGNSKSFFKAIVFGQGATVVQRLLKKLQKNQRSLIRETKKAFVAERGSNAKHFNF